MKMLLATGNPAKRKLFSTAFSNLGFEIIPGNSKVDVVEVEPTPVSNALLKARASWQPNYFVFADDSGLAIDALNGEPGTQTRRWNGVFDSTVSDEVWLNYLMKRLEGVPLERRTAKFVSGWAIMGPRGEVVTREVLTPFEIALKPFREMEPGFPLSAVGMRKQEDLVERVLEEIQHWQEFLYIHSNYKGDV